MTFWGWILSIFIILALLGFFVVVIEQVTDFNLDDWCRKQQTAKAKSGSADSCIPPHQDSEPKDDCFIKINITGSVHVHIEEQQKD